MTAVQEEVPENQGNTRRNADAGQYRFENKESLEHAVNILIRLGHIPNLTSLVPKLAGRDDTRLEIQIPFPTCGLWTVVEGLDPDAGQASLRVEHVRQLRDALLHDVAILCDSQIACHVDTSNLQFAWKRKGKRRVPVPLLHLNHFCRQQHSVDKDVLIQSIRSQFTVLKLLAHMAPSFSGRSPQIQDYHDTGPLPDLNLDPDHVVKILRAGVLPMKLENLIIRVNRFSAELARYAAEEARKYLYILPKRDGPPDQPLQSIVIDYARTIEHVLNLIEVAHSSPTSEGHRALATDESTLRVIYTALLVQAYSNTIPHNYSKDLLQLRFQHEHEHADGDGALNTIRVDDDREEEAAAAAYSSYEAFCSMVEARSKAAEGVQKLYAQGGRLDEKCRWLLIQDKVDELLDRHHRRCVY
ncbi:uncharacterized protein BCR38DRAFT_525127 [Pseudomassariella vexata]|uniref:Uncharacterized protein n=1 Tax=Pseudomassariella vexata TaxID=1141098 RepID=A0A1Y2DS05_9PEZI|nr:uncharacterized protein BCR38DRAFT_525127 [Pseudomassariella vexata]ORY62058.1 hypothetical protein BCR38DRAFT_525127 [Pseudomassariella vexata]